MLKGVFSIAKHATPVKSPPWDLARSMPHFFSIASVSAHLIVCFVALLSDVIQFLSLHNDALSKKIPPPFFLSAPYVRFGELSDPLSGRLSKFHIPSELGENDNVFWGSFGFDDSSASILFLDARSHSLTHQFFLGALRFLFQLSLWHPPNHSLHPKKRFGLLSKIL